MRVVGGLNILFEHEITPTRRKNKKREEKSEFFLFFSKLLLGWCAE